MSQQLRPLADSSYAIKAYFAPLPLIRKRGAVFHLYLRLQRHPQFIWRSGGRSGWRDVSQAYRYRHMYERG